MTPVELPSEVAGVKSRLYDAGVRYFKFPNDAGGYNIIDWKTGDKTSVSERAPYYFGSATTPSPGPNSQGSQTNSFPPPLPTPTRSQTQSPSKPTFNSNAFCVVGTSDEINACRLNENRANGLVEDLWLKATPQIRQYCIRSTNQSQSYSALWACLEENKSREIAPTNAGLRFNLVDFINLQMSRIRFATFYQCDTARSARGRGVCINTPP
jgi:hypothetical protein